MNSHEIRSRFLEFFRARDHAIIPSASLVPENDPSVLFNTAGVQPLVPYLLGEEHPQGTRLANSQKCVRMQDIDEVGDNTHDTFFEMLGNWSLGDYFKKEAIQWSYEFLTSKEEGLGLDPARLYVTVFEGDENAPRDDESAEIWKSLGVPEHRIYFLPGESNWWSLGDDGPCGSDTEMFYDVTEEGLGDMTKEEYLKADDDQKVVEVWNVVFMEYEKSQGKVVGKLARKNVDTGAGLERLAMTLQQKDNVFDTDLFDYLMEHFQKVSGSDLPAEASAQAGEIRPRRILADHMRTAVLIIGDGVVPANSERGYILRRLLRRSVRYADMIGVPEGDLQNTADLVAEKYKGIYDNLTEHLSDIRAVIREEENKFRKTIAAGMKEFEKIADKSGNNISGTDAFQLFSTYGFPFEMTQELALERNMTVDESGFAKEMQQHQMLSRAGAEKKFKGGLADHSEMSVKYHTATHLLHQALRDVLGDHVLQKGSNITTERLRFDFSHDEKMTDDEKKQVETIVNDKIAAALPVSYEDIPMEEAQKRGAIGLFEEKYGDKVRVYEIGEGDDAYSLEFCGGPHVKNTSELGVRSTSSGQEVSATFKIKKEEAVSAGVRRIKAVLEAGS